MGHLLPNEGHACAGGAVERTIDEEWDGKVAVAVGEYRARVALEVERIVAEG